MRRLKPVSERGIYGVTHAASRQMRLPPSFSPAVRPLRRNRRAVTRGGIATTKSGRALPPATVAHACELNRDSALIGMKELPGLESSNEIKMEAPQLIFAYSYFSTTDSAELMK